MLSDGPITWLRQIRKGELERERERKAERDGGYVMHSTEPFLLLLSIKAGGSAPA